MADPASYGNPDRDIEQAIKALKKGTQLIKYSRKGKPKFKNFRLSPDEKQLIWNSHGGERHLNLPTVSRIIPGQRTAVFKRYLRPEKEYLSFSLIYHNGERSLDLICKDKAETEVWLAGLKSLISTGSAHNRRGKSESSSELHGSGDFFQDFRHFGSTLDSTSSISYGSGRLTNQLSFSSSSGSTVGYECADMQMRTSAPDGFRISVSSTHSCSSQNSGPEDIESLGDVYLWGEVWSDAVATYGNRNPISIKNDVLTPKPLETRIVLDVHQISCGARHIALVTRQGEVFTWGEELGGRLGHGIEKDFSRPRLVDYLAVTNIEFVSCGEFHTCALSASGDLYSWGDGAHYAGLLGQGNDISHWIPKRISGPLEDLQVQLVACGTWHSALATSSGNLFTFGEGTFGALGHGDRENVPHPKEVQSLSGLKAIAVCCGVWHTAAIVEVINQACGNVSSRRLYTWGDGDKYRLGHGNKDTLFYPTCVSALSDYNIHQIACGYNMTAALTTSGHVFTMGSNVHGELGNPNSDGKLPKLVQERLVGEFVEQISCGAEHVAVLTSRSEVFTWGRGANGRLGHGDTENHNIPTLVEALKDRVVRNITCGSSYTASICLHKWIAGADQSVCSACRQPFGFTRKRHNCYNCGLVHCHACSSKKALKAALAPTPAKPHRVCDSCYAKLKKVTEVGSAATINRKASGHRTSFDMGGIRGESRVLLSPNVDPIKHHEVKAGSPGTSSDNYSMVRASQVPSTLQLKDITFPSSLGAIQHALKPVAISPWQPQQIALQSQSSSRSTSPYSQSNSRPTSPYTRRPSPTRSNPVYSKGVIDSLRKSNEQLTQEISKLQSQIASLKQKSEAQDAETRKFKKRAEEVYASATDKSSKYNRALQAMKTIVDQLNDIAEKLPPEISDNESFKSFQAQVECLLETSGTQAAEDATELTHDRRKHKLSISQSRDGYGSEETIEGTPPRTSSENGSSNRKESIEQFEPGVYVTFVQHADGTNSFKRVRFSKRRFSGQQAEEWWKENKDRMLKRYNIPKSSRTSSDAATAASKTGDYATSTP